MGQEYKIKIKSGVINLLEKNSRYEKYKRGEGGSNAKENNAGIIDRLCKLADELSDQNDFYQTELPKTIDYILNSADIAWEPICSAHARISEIDRSMSMFGGFPWTSKSYPWPTYEDEHGDVVYCAPGIQINLVAIKKVQKIDLGDGLLQVWFTDVFKDNNVLVRIIPKDVIEDEVVATKIEDFKISWQIFVGENTYDKIDFPGWGIEGWEMVGVQIDSSISYKLGFQEIDGTGLGAKSRKIIGNIYKLLEADEGDYRTTLFGVPDPIQKPWQGFYEDNNHNLLSLNSEDYIQLGDDSSGQLMYKKQNGKIGFSFEWSCD
jgi:hypothetical protein